MPAALTPKGLVNLRKSGASVAGLQQADAGQFARMRIGKTWPATQDQRVRPPIKKPCQVHLAGFLIQLFNWLAPASD
jgi:hypothetical protein